jgi:hypothetical protein
MEVCLNAIVSIQTQHNPSTQIINCASFAALTALTALTSLTVLTVLTSFATSPFGSDLKKNKTLLRLKTKW